jgi:hypothetical protein
MKEFLFTISFYPPKGLTLKISDGLDVAELHTDTDGTEVAQWIHGLEAPSEARTNILAYWDKYLGKVADRSYSKDKTHTLYFTIREEPKLEIPATVYSAKKKPLPDLQNPYY